MKYTFITTNLMPSELSEKYGLRLADRFREMFDVIAYEHPSYRTM
jgi:DNA replication protein DnaC